MIVQDTYKGLFPYEHTNTKEFVQNFEIYIGNDPTYSANQRCPGGPFQVVGDPKSYTRVETDKGYSGDMWNYGIEAWCNMEGQYMHIVADLKHLNGQVYEQSICSVGIMGTEYLSSYPT